MYAIDLQKQAYSNSKKISINGRDSGFLILKKKATELTVIKKIRSLD